MDEAGLTREAETPQHTPHEHGEHDHDSCERGAIAHAEAVSAATGLRFTEQRRKVLAALAESHVPASAYEVIDRLARDGPRPAPVSVYRALEFLVDNGFAHRIESPTSRIRDILLRHDFVARYLGELGNHADADTVAIPRVRA